jgi:hypothetical protein
MALGRRGGTEMNATWIPLVSAVAIILLGLAVLEVMSEGVRVDQSPTVWRLWDTPAHSGPAVLDTPDDLLTLGLGPNVDRDTAEMTLSAGRDDR